MHPQQAEIPHHLGHRQRLRRRLMEGGGSALADYEVLEMILFSAHPRGDVKPLAKRLLAKFGGLAKLFNAERQALLAVEGMGDAAVAALKIVQVAAERILREPMTERPILQSWTALLDYARMSMAHKKVEEFRIIFLNHKNALIGDEVQQRGTIDHTPVYPREVVKRALELGASAIILLHNHPTGDPTPSKADINVTKQIIAAATPLGIMVHDHLVVGEKDHFSFKSNGLL